MTDVPLLRLYIVVNKLCTCMQMRDSAKFQLLVELLPELRSAGHRVLLFSQWTSILDLVEWLMQVLIAGWLCLSIDRIAA